MDLISNGSNPEVYTHFLEGDDADLSDDQLARLKFYAGIILSDDLIDRGLVTSNHLVPNCTVRALVAGLFQDNSPAVAKLVPADPRPK